MTTSSPTRAQAEQLDAEDELRGFRDRFHFPRREDGSPFIYLCGNSLGLQPKSAAAFLDKEMEDWKNLGVEGHFHGDTPWTLYHENLTETMASIVGARPAEVSIANTLTVNVHLMLTSFYRPGGRRRKVLIEADAFPSDKYAVQSQMRWHGLDPDDCLIELAARPGEVLLRDEDIKAAIEEAGDELALVLFGNTNYYTGQFFDMPAITKWAHGVGALVGFDCAHAAGNQILNFHDTGCDFAVWCTYKYLNSGPGSIAGLFVHERHLGKTDIPRLEGWWGHNKATRFNMRGDFDPIPTADAWQLSCPPVFSMAPIWASLRLFEEAGMERLRAKSIRLTGYLAGLVKSLGEDVVNIITPGEPERRGAQLSVQVLNADKSLFDAISAAGVIVDWREPDVIRVAPAPLYNSFGDAFDFYEVLRGALGKA